MNALNHAFFADVASMPLFPQQPDGFCAEQVDPVQARWEALHDAADALAAMLGRQNDGKAGRPNTTISHPLHGHGYPSIAETAMADLSVMMEQGLFAILRAREQGADGHVAARALLSRFEREREKLLSRIATTS